MDLVQRKSELTGERFGSLTVMSMLREESHNRIMYRCVCTCGKSIDISENMLLYGNKCSCGCKNSHTQDLRGRRFSSLMCIDPVKGRAKDGSVRWLCECDCGGTVIVSSNKLMTGHTTSCGCAAGRGGILSKTFIDGTCIEIMLSEKIPKNNTSGIRGVTRKRNKWQAYITYGGKRQYLGSYDTREEAAKARSNAEEKIRDHIDFLLEKENLQKDA